MGDIIEAYVAFDTSKLRNAVAIAQAGRAGEVRFLDETYEAGPTGYGLYRQIKSFGHECMVVAAVAHSEEAWRAGEDQPARCGQSGQAAARWRSHGALVSRPASRGDA